MPIPRITIAIPTYNRAGYLREALASALAQTYTEWRLVIGDDASNDDTAEVVASFHDPRFHYFRHPQNIGITPNWRFVFGRADTEFVAPLADDDQFLPDHLTTALEILDRHPAVPYYTSAAEYFGEGASGQYRPHAIADTTTPLLYFPPRAAARFLGIDNPGPMNSMLCRRAALQGNLFWGKPDYLPQDLLLMTQLMAQGGVLFGNRVTSRYRLHAANVSRAGDRRSKILRYNCMVWYGIRWLAQFLLERGICDLADIERHGMEATSDQHVVPLVLGLASLDSPPPLRALARRVFAARREMDPCSERFRFARRFGFGVLPWLERIAQVLAGWRP